MEGDSEVRNVSVVTGYLAYPYLKKLAERLEQKFPATTIRVYPIRNDFFGEQITVSGLITGQDLLHQLKGRELGDKLLLPCNMFRSGEEVLLDDVTLSQVKDALQVDVDIVKSSGQDFIEGVLIHHE